MTGVVHLRWLVLPVYLALSAAIIVGLGSQLGLGHLPEAWTPAGSSLRIKGAGGDSHRK